MLATAARWLTRRLSAADRIEASLGRLERKLTAIADKLDAHHAETQLLIGKLLGKLETPDR